MANLIARVKLAPGEIGYYDQLSNVHLTLSNPIGEVYDDCNYSRIKKAIANNQLILIEGTLAPTISKVDYSKHYTVWLDTPVRN